MALTTEDLQQIKGLFKHGLIAERKHTKKMMKTEISSAINASEKRLLTHMDKRFDEVYVSVGEVITAVNDHIDERFAEARLETAEMITGLNDHIDHRFDKFERITRKHSADIAELQAAKGA
jgi:DNA repair ATPase RecN